MSIIFIIVFLAAFGVFLLLNDQLDRQRIREHVKADGGDVLNISWNSFVRDWLRRSSERTYDVRYKTSSGLIVTATCKTSMLSGVRWIPDSPNDFGNIGEGS